MKRINPLATIIAGSMLSCTVLSYCIIKAQAQEQDWNCRSTIATVTSDIERRLGGKVAYVRYEDIDNSPYPNASGHLDLVLGDPEYSRPIVQRNQDILASTQLQKRYAQQLIASCSRVVSVEFALYATGGTWFGWYLATDGQVKEFGCVDRPSPRVGGTLQRLPWGLRYCW